jgi:hypothetical protein
MSGVCKNNKTKYEASDFLVLFELNLIHVVRVCPALLDYILLL